IYMKNIMKQTTLNDVSSSTTIEDIKYQYQESQGTPYGSQRLYFAGELREDHKTLRDYNISKDATIHCTMRLTGGK
ncbi:ubiquitin, minor isoform, partial [Wilcoxina mikolae CBS 423.85]